MEIAQLFHNFSQSNLESTAAAKPMLDQWMQTILSVRLDEFQLFKMLRLTIDNHRDSGLHLLIKSNDVCVYCMKRGEEAQIKQPNDIKFPSWRLAKRLPKPRG